MDNKPYLVEERRDVSHVVHRIRGEQPRGPRHGSDVPPALDKIDGMDIVDIRDARAAQSAHELGKNIRGDLPPGKTTERRKRDGDGGVQMTA